MNWLASHLFLHFGTVSPDLGYLFFSRTQLLNYMDLVPLAHWSSSAISIYSMIVSLFSFSTSSWGYLDYSYYLKKFSVSATFLMYQYRDIQFFYNLKVKISIAIGPFLFPSWHLFMLTFFFLDYSCQKLINSLIISKNFAFCLD